MVEGLVYGSPSARAGRDRRVLREGSQEAFEKGHTYGRPKRMVWYPSTPCLVGEGRKQVPASWREQLQQRAAQKELWPSLRAMDNPSSCMEGAGETDTPLGSPLTSDLQCATHRQSHLETARLHFNVLWYSQPPEHRTRWKRCEEI